MNQADLRRLLETLEDEDRVHLLAILLEGSNQTLQINQGQAKGYQVKVEGGVVYIGDIHIDVDLLKKVFQDLSQQSQSAAPYFYPQDFDDAIFVGRDREMADLHDLLQKVDRVAIAAVGMGGVGKTTLARRYAQEYQSEYPGGIWWVSARGLVTEVLGCAGRSIGLETLDPGMDEAAIVRHYFGRWEAAFPGRKLLVLDDVGEFGAVKGYLPQSGAFQVLMTTRVRMQRPVSCLDLGVLESGAAVALLRKLVDNDRPFDGAAAIELCAWLGYLPLAIELVGRYLAETGTIASVLAELKAKSLDAAAIDEVPSEMNYERNVRSAIGLSWEPLDERARRVLLMVSVFAIGPIELGWVRDCLPEMEDVEAILDRVLVKRSLLEKREGRYQMHALVREFVGGRFAADRERIKRMDGGSGDELGGRFAQVITAIAQTIPQAVTLGVQARVRGAVPQMEEVAARWTEILADDNKTWCCTGLARFYQGLSLWQEAERFYLRALAISETHLGPDHPDTASSLNNLAGLYQLIGRYGEAEPLYVSSLAISETHLGPDHPNTAASLNNLAGLYRLIGRYGEAEPLYVRSLAISETHLGPDHPDTASSLNNLAVLYNSIGRYAEAEPLFVRALAISETHLGPDHPDTAANLNNLALLYNSIRRYAEAEPLFVRALAINETHLGPDHPNTAQSLNNLALLYNAIGRYAEAEPLFVRALAIRETQLGPNHPDTAQSLNNLAVLYAKMKQYDRALPLLEQALSIRQEVLPTGHPDIAGTQHSLTNLRQAMGGN